MATTGTRSAAPTVTSAEPSTDSGPWDLTLAYVGELVESQLSIDAIHRLYRGCSSTELAQALAASFDQAPAGRSNRSMAARGGRARCAVPGAPRRHGHVADTEACGVRRRVRDLDGALLEHALRDVEVDVTLPARRQQRGRPGRVGCRGRGRADQTDGHCRDQAHGRSNAC